MGPSLNPSSNWSSFLVHLLNQKLTLSWRGPEIVYFGNSKGTFSNEMFSVLLFGEQLTSRTRCMNSWWPRLKGLRMCWEVPNDLVIGELVELHSLCPVDTPLWQSPIFLLWHFETKPIDHYINIDLNVLFLVYFLGWKMYPILLFEMMILWSNIWTSATKRPGSHWSAQNNYHSLRIQTPPLR